MFTTGFGRDVLAPAGAGRPGWVAAPVHFFAIHVAQHPVMFNSAAAAVQLTLGVGFLVRRTVRAAIVAWIGWSLAVWWFGEGLGGLAQRVTRRSPRPGRPAPRLRDRCVGRGALGRTSSGPRPTRTRRAPRHRGRAGRGPRSGSVPRRCRPYPLRTSRAPLPHSSACRRS